MNLSEQMKDVSLSYWVAHKRSVNNLVNILEKTLEKYPDKKVGIDWLNCSDNDISMHIVDREWLKKLLTKLTPIKDRVKFTNLSSPGLIKMIKETAKEIEPLKKTIEEEKKEMMKLLKEIACEDIAETDDGTSFSFEDDDMKVVVLDKTFEIDSPVVLKIFV